MASISATFLGVLIPVFVEGKVMLSVIFVAVFSICFVAFVYDLITFILELW